VNFELLKLSRHEIERLNPLRGQTILVTGGTGYVGKWIYYFVKHLNNQYELDIKLILVARGIDGPFNIEINLQSFVSFIRSDIRQIKNLPAHINYIIHAASSPDNRLYMSNPIDSIDIITSGTKQLFEASLELDGLKNILNLSSGQIYGAVNSDHITEDDFGSLNVGNIGSIYSEAKRYSETLSLAYRTIHKLPIVQVRPFAFVGPLMDLNMPWAINNFVRDAIKFSKIKIVGNGSPIRSYMYPADMVYWILVMLIYGKTGQAYNLGSNEGVSLFDLAKKIKNILGEKIDIEVLNMNESNFTFVPDISKVNKEFNLTIKVDFDTALKNTINWFVNK